MLDAIQEAGPETIIYEFGSGEGGSVNGAQPAWRLMRLIGGTTLDSNGLTSDYNVGLYQTFGKFNFCSSIDDWFHSDLILIWHMNPLYTRIPSAHFIQEARYHGTEIVSIAPDYNASSIHSDLFVALEPGTDAALALAMCKVILDDNKVNEPFVKEQTDLPFLVRRDNGRFLRQSDLEEDGRDDQFYLLEDRSGKVVPAPRGTLDLGGTEPSLYGETRGDPGGRRHGQGDARLRDAPRAAAGVHAGGGVRASPASSPASSASWPARWRRPRPSTCSRGSASASTTTAT